MFPSDLLVCGVVAMALSWSGISGLGESVTFVPAGSRWKYLDDGSNQGTAWSEANYNDNAWKSGNAELGYGDASDGRPEVTVIGYGPVATNKYITTYFRYSFKVTNTANCTNLVFRLLRDDGAVVYLNGTELYRQVMPSGTINYLTPATNAVVNMDETTYFTNQVAPTYLVIGTNVVAVEIHQVNGNSSDVSFDLEMIGQFRTSGNSPPTVTLTNLPWGQYFRTSNNLTLTASASDPDGSISKVEFFDGVTKLGEDALSPYQFVWNNPPAGLHLLTAVATDNLQARSTSAVLSVTVLANNAPWPILFTTGSVWKYMDTGTNLGTAWRAPSFDDRAWPSGRAELGYGDDADGRPEATRVSYGPSATNKYITTYFRRSFNETNAAGYTNLYGRLLCDDGAVVYLNGMEVYRLNMPSGIVSNTMLANVTVGGTDETIFLWTRRINPKLLQEGTNVLAVEIHQCSVSSTDISFDMELLGNVTGPDPTFPLTAGQRGIVRCLAYPDKWYEIYLPPTYSTTGTPLPILFTFRPGGGHVIDDFQSIASNMQIILVSSEFFSYAWPGYGDVIHAIVRDVRDRVNYDPSALFATGFSGGGLSSFQFSQVRAPQVAGVLSMAGWLGRQPGQYLITDRWQTNLLVARLTGDADTSAIYFLGYDSNQLSSCEAVIHDWTFSGGHVVPPDSVKIAGLNWLLAQRIRPGPNDRSNALAQASTWRARLAAGQTEAVLRECVNSLLTKPRTWETYYAEGILDEIQADYDAFRQLDVSELAYGELFLDYFFFRIGGTARLRDQSLYFSSMKSLTASGSPIGDRLSDLQSTMYWYGYPEPVILNVAQVDWGVDVFFSRDAIGLIYNLQWNNSLNSTNWISGSRSDIHRGHCIWSLTQPGAISQANFYRLKVSVY